LLCVCAKVELAAGDQTHKQLHGEQSRIAEEISKPEARHAGALVLVRRHRLLRGNIDGKVIILIVLVFVLFACRGMVFQIVANRTRTALRFCHAVALVG
jgi:hypothetical protein